MRKLSDNTFRARLHLVRPFMVFSCGVLVISTSTSEVHCIMEATATMMKAKKARKKQRKPERASLSPRRF